MKTLHIVNKSPEKPSIMERCLNFSSKGDSLLLIEDAAYFALPSTISKITSRLDALQIKIYALEEDLVARGINKKIHGSIQIVNYEGFVELTTTHNKSSSWY